MSVIQLNLTLVKNIIAHAENYFKKSHKKNIVRIL